MAKLTKMGFKRRKIVLGATLLASVGLISTGFASWVVSQNASKDATGNVKISAIENQTVSFIDIAFNDTNSSILFEPAKDDKTGHFMWDGTNSENLSVSFTTTVSNVKNLAGIKVSAYAYTLDGNNEVKNQSISAAATANYIVLPASFSIDGDTIKTSNTENFTTSDNGSTYTFTYKVEFKWGSEFNSKNPSIALDDAITNKSLTLDAATSKMLLFYNTLCGTNHTSLEECNSATELKFKITIEAVLTSVNSGD